MVSVVSHLRERIEGCLFRDDAGTYSEDEGEDDEVERPVRVGGVDREVLVLKTFICSPCEPTNLIDPRPWATR